MTALQALVHLTLGAYPSVLYPDPALPARPSLLMSLLDSGGLSVSMDLLRLDGV